MDHIVLVCLFGENRLEGQPALIVLGPVSIHQLGERGEGKLAVILGLEASQSLPAHKGHSFGGSGIGDFHRLVGNRGDHVAATQKVAFGIHKFHMDGVNILFRFALDTQAPAISVGSPLAVGGVVGKGNRSELADAGGDGMCAVLQAMALVECLGIGVAAGELQLCGVDLPVHDNITQAVSAVEQGKDFVAVVHRALGRGAVGKVLDCDLNEVRQHVQARSFRSLALDADGLSHIIACPLAVPPSNVEEGLVLGRGADVGVLRHFLVHIILFRVVIHIQDDTITGRRLLA